MARSVKRRAALEQSCTMFVHPPPPPPGWRRHDFVILIAARPSMSSSLLASPFHSVCSEAVYFFSHPVIQGIIDYASQFKSPCFFLLSPIHSVPILYLSDWTPLAHLAIALKRRHAFTIGMPRI